jgi:ATP-independent RNA helicase DbpA
VSQAFTHLPLQQALLDNLTSLNYLEMTEIQAQSLPLMLAGKDVIAQAKTGSGKTAAFGLSLLNKLDVKRFRIQSLVLCPTRELAEQVAKELRTLARQIHNIKILSLCGGMPIGPQIGSLEHGAHIIIGTPGRIEEHLRKNTLQLRDVTTVVFDEADRMLDMGFEESINNIIEHVPTKRQTLLFSATFADNIEQVAARFLHQPQRITVDSSVQHSDIEELYYSIADTNRVDALRLLLLEHKPPSCVVFCNTKAETQQLEQALKQHGFSAIALHGDLEQRLRDQALIRFSQGSVSILVATDVAARGLDINKLDAVINYDIARDLQVHTHRIGRTGRAGNKGLACTLFAEKQQFKLQQLEEYCGHALNIATLPEQSLLLEKPYYPAMVTLQIDAGKKNKLRPGDIVGALTNGKDIDGNNIGNITINDFKAYVAVTAPTAKKALAKISQGKIKGKSFKARLLT